MCRLMRRLPSVHLHLRRTMKIWERCPCVCVCVCVCVCECVCVRFLCDIVSYTCLSVSKQPFEVHQET